MVNVVRLAFGLAMPLAITWAISTPASAQAGTECAAHSYVVYPNTKEKGVASLRSTWRHENCTTAGGWKQGKAAAKKK
jgi:hypothetical protein